MSLAADLNMVVDLMSCVENCPSPVEDLALEVDMTSVVDLGEKDLVLKRDLDGMADLWWMAALWR